MGSHVGSDMGLDQMWDQKATQLGLEALRPVHAVKIDCWHKAHKACAHMWVIIGAMPCYGRTSGGARTSLV